MRELVSRIVEELAKRLAGPDSVEDAVDHMLVGRGVAGLASGERIDGDAFISGHVDA